MTATIASRRARRATGHGRRILVALTLLTGLLGFGTTSVLADLASPVTVTTTASSNPVASGDHLTYTIDVVNTGGAQADEVVLTDQVAGMTGLVLTSTVGTCTATNELVTCDAGTLQGFQSWRVTIRGLVTAAAGTTLHNTVSVSGTRSSQTFSTAHSIDTLVGTPPAGPRPDLRLSISAPTTAAPGSVVTYDLTVNNSGGTNATDVTVVNTLPGGWDFLSAAGSSLFSCTEAFDTVTCKGGAVDSGANALITIKATAGNAGVYDDTAMVDPFDTIAELSELNNSASARTTLVAPAPPVGTLTITKNDAPDPLRPGDLLTYTIVAKNTAVTRADSVRVTDGTQGLDAASITASTTKGACTVAASEVVCTQTSPTLRLEPNESMTVTITGRVVSTPGSLVRNTATVTGNIKNVGHTNTAMTTTSVRPGVDLTITQRAVTNHADHPGAPAFRAYDRFDYVITVGNSGLDTANGVVVREPLPEGITYLGAAVSPGSGFVCAEEEPLLIACRGGTIPGTSLANPGGTTAKITLTVVAPNKIGPITATATADPTNAIFEGDENNNIVTTTTNILTGIDLTVMKAANFNPVAPSGTLIYTITVKNVGTQDTTGVVVRDTLPAGTRFREAIGDPDHNFTCGHNGQVGPATGGGIDCIGGILRGTFNHTLPPDEATITIKLFAPPQPGLIKNQVRVDPVSAIPEIDESNNINTLSTAVAIPATPGGDGAYHSFTISQTDAPDPVAPSGSLVYTVKVKNHGSDVAFGVDVRDFLPEGSVFRSAKDTQPGAGAFACTESGGVVDCVDGTLDGTVGQTQAPNDQERTIEISVFAPEQPGKYTNLAIVDPGDEIPEANETDNSASDVTTVAIGGGGVYRELTVTKTQVSPAGNVAPSGIIEWELEPKNHGSDAAFNVAVRDVLPAGTTFRFATDTSAAGTGAFTCSHANGVVDCVGGTLDGTADQTPGDQSRKIKLSAFAPSQTGTYRNHAFIDPDDTVAEANEANNETSSEFTVALGGGGSYIDLKMEKTGPATVQPLEEVTYQLKVSNGGTADAFNVAVRDFLPSNATFVSARDANPGDGAFACSQSDTVVNCTGGYVPPGGNRTITVKVTAPNRHDAKLINQAIVDPDHQIAEASEINNTASTSTDVISQHDLTVANDGSGAVSGDEGTWTFSVSLAGPSAVRNVVVETDLPVGVIPLDVQAPDDTNWSCQITENPISEVTCVGSLVEPGGPYTFTVQVYTTAQDEQIHSTTRVDPANTVAEFNEDNNVAQGTGL